MKKYSWTKTGNSRRIWKNKRLTQTIVLGLVVLSLLWLTPRFLSWSASLIMTPIVATENWLSKSTSAVPSFFRDRSNLIERRRELEQDILELQAAKEESRWLARENDELRRLLGGQADERIAAGIIGRPTELPYDVLILDQGSRDGVSENAAVYVGPNQAIGFVAAVYERTSVVALVSSPGFESTVYIYGPNIYTTAVGLGGGTLRVNVPQGILLAAGDLVVMPSFRGGLYGAISVVESAPTRPEQFGYLSMEVPLQSLRFVTVSKDALSPLGFEEAKEVVENVRLDLLSVPVPEGVLVDVPVDEATSTATSTES